MSIIIKQSTAETVPTGEYLCSVIDIEETEGQFGPQLAWQFVIQDGAHSGKTLRGWTSTSFSIKSKLYAWTRALFDNREIPATYVWNSDDVTGRSARLVVVEQSREDGSSFNKVMSLKPVNNQQAALPLQPQQQQQGFPPVAGAAERDDIPF